MDDSIITITYILFGIGCAITTWEISKKSGFDRLYTSVISGIFWTVSLWLMVAAALIYTKKQNKERCDDGRP